MSQMYEPDASEETGAECMRCALWQLPTGFMESALVTQNMLRMEKRIYALDNCESVFSVCNSSFYFTIDEYY